eukprot:9113079-Alexandrium_andersonii.AAC.1
MRALGLRCLNFGRKRPHHEHAQLAGGETTRSAAYPWEFCKAYARCVECAPQILQWLTDGLVVRRVSKSLR